MYQVQRYKACVCERMTDSQHTILKTIDEPNEPETVVNSLSHWKKQIKNIRSNPLRNKLELNF